MSFSPTAPPSPPTALVEATIFVPTARPRSPGRLGRVAWAVSDSLALTWRNLITQVRLPMLLVFSLLQPTIFVLMFRYVFGGSIQPALALTQPGVDYINYLMPGIFVQTAVFGAMATGVGLAEDAQRGLIERFRSLPIARSAVLAGRTIADSLRNVLVLVLMAGVGLAVGFRPGGTLAHYLVALGIVLLFAHALSWVVAAIGLSAPNAETAMAMIFPLIAPLVFASSAFVLPELMPGWLQAFVIHQPVTITIDAVRRLVLGDPTELYVLGSVAWSVGLILVFTPLAVAQYRKGA